MKKLLSTTAISLLIFLFIFIDSHFPNSKYILLGIYILFPIGFIIQSIISSNSIKNMLIEFLLLTLSIAWPIHEWYNIVSMTTPLVIYISLGILTFFLIKILNIVKIKYIK